MSCERKGGYISVFLSYDCYAFTLGLRVCDTWCYVTECIVDRFVGAVVCKIGNTEDGWGGDASTNKRLADIPIGVWVSLFKAGVSSIYIIA